MSSKLLKNAKIKGGQIMKGLKHQHKILFKVKLSPMMVPTFSGLFFTCLLLPGLIQGQEDAADAPSARSSCPEGFAFHGSHCYGLLGVINNEIWNSAELLCQAHPSGHLVSLLNKAEADFVATMIKEYPGVQSPIWIGLHDPNKNRRWRWSSNALFLYQAWETGFPSKSSPSYCVSLSFESGELRVKNNHTYSFYPVLFFSMHSVNL
ncbi:lithostathine-like [Gracilinanus agilis]|uniref:lithostathine-like n=1 Tax=Gracilinanus agilis TaxID=191870 RepID=UPI001CFD8A8C|nr:lithostathine-like [Gracilinanus agilis]